MNKRLYYKGIPLKKYCHDNGLDYNVVIAYKQKIMRVEQIDEEEAIEQTVKHYENRNNLTEKQKLYLYCKEHNYVYNSLLKAWKKLVTKYNMEESAAREEVIRRHEIYKDRGKQAKLYYLGMPLEVYCQIHELNFLSLCSKRLALMKEQYISGEEATKIAVKIYEENLEFKKLKEICHANNLNYAYILRYRRMIAKRKAVSIEEATEEAIKHYKLVLERENKKRERKALVTNLDNLNYIISFCQTKNLSIENFRELISEGYTPLLAINLIDKLGEEKENIKGRVVSIEIIREIDKKVEIALSDKNAFELGYLLYLYNLGYKDIVFVILERVMPLVYKLIGKQLSNGKKDMAGYVRMKILSLLEDEIFEREYHFLAYLIKYIKGQLIELYNRNKREFSYEYSSDNTVEKTHARGFDNVASIEDEVIKKEHYRQIRDILESSLTQNELKYICARFGLITRPYTMEEIAENNGKPIDKIRAYEEKILTKLRTNDNLRSLIELKKML